MSALLHGIGMLGVLLVIFCIATEGSFAVAVYGVSMVIVALAGLGAHPEDREYDA